MTKPDYMPRPLEGFWMKTIFLLFGGFILVVGFGVLMVGTILQKMVGLSELWSNLGGGALGFLVLMVAFFALS